MGGGSPRLEEGYLARKRPQRRSVRAFVDTSALLALLILATSTTRVLVSQRDGIALPVAGS
jgi:hypothetical protein